MGVKEVSFDWRSESETVAQLPTKDDHVGEVHGGFLTRRIHGIGTLTVEATRWENRLNGLYNIAGGRTKKVSGIVLKW